MHSRFPWFAVAVRRRARTAPARRLTATANLIALCVLAGCGGTETGETGDVYADHEHEDRPAHHPESFPAAIDALRARLPAVAGGHARSAAEAADIAGWMPELAADSDLAEAQWAPLAAGANELNALLPRIAAGDGEATTRTLAVLDRLAASVREYGEEEFEVTPHEPHDHGDNHDH